MDFRTHLSTYLLFFLAIFTLASRAGELTCTPPTSQPRLSSRGCRLAIQEFSQRYPSITPPRTSYVLTHLTCNPRLFIKCPLVIEREGCVLTLDYKYLIPRHFLHLNIEKCRHMRIYARTAVCWWAWRLWWRGDCMGNLYYSQAGESSDNVGAYCAPNK